MQDFFEQNLAILYKKSPELCSLLKSNSPENQYKISLSKAGFPTLTVVFPDGTSRALHSKYNPIKEAARLINTSISNHSNYILNGLGLGYHLIELIKKSSQKTRIIVIEKNPSIVHLAFTYNDLSSVIKHPGVSFHIGIDPTSLEQILSKDLTNLAIDGYAPIDFKPLVELENNYYSSIKKQLTLIHQNFQLDINTQAVFSKKFYKNIFDNGNSIVNSPGIKTLKNIFNEYPAIIVAAGPSLDKNISLIKSARNNIIVLAVATALKPLLKNGINPDFVIAVDPNEETLQSFNIEGIPDDMCLIYDPCIPSSITSLFKGKRIVIDSKIALSRWLADHSEEKGSLGKVFSVAHSAFYISKFMGCSPIILVGQDLSFDGHRMHCTDSFYNQVNQDNINSGRTLNIVECNKFRNYSPSMKQTFSIFNKNLNTTRAMDTYKDQFKNEINGNTRILNATEGGVDIFGAENLSLREALHNYCKIGGERNKNDYLKKIRQPKTNKNLIKTIITQKNIFDRLFYELKKIESKYVKIDQPATKSEHFVLRMKSLYKDLLDDTATVHLIQGYDYLGFIEWKQRNQKIIEAEGKIPNENILQQKFIRDRAFLDTLLNTTKHLSSGFKSWLKINN